MIAPTVGRSLWYRPSKDDVVKGMSIVEGEPLPAILAGVGSETSVNLAVFDANGNHFSRTAVTLVQEGQDKPKGAYAEWMPYQIGQASKTVEPTPIKTVSLSK